MAVLAHPHSDQVRLASGLDVLAAIWLFISAFAVAVTPSMAWSNGIIAVIVFVLAATRAFGAYAQSWMSWFNAILGLWVLVSPWILLTTPPAAIVTNNVITGAVMIVLAAWSAIATNSEHTSASPPPTM